MVPLKTGVFFSISTGISKHISIFVGYLALPHIPCLSVFVMFMCDDKTHILFMSFALCPSQYSQAFLLNVDFFNDQMMQDHILNILLNAILICVGTLTVQLKIFSEIYCGNPYVDVFCQWGSVCCVSHSLFSAFTSLCMSDLKHVMRIGNSA